MTVHSPGEQVAGPPDFDALMAEVMAATERFGHREHLHLTWLAVRRVGVPAAVGLVSDGIQRTARYAGVPQKYRALPADLARAHDTVTARSGSRGISAGPSQQRQH